MMLDLLKNILARINLGIMLSILGLVLAVGAFWFDIFGFKTDRRENAATSEAIAALSAQQGPPEVSLFKDAPAFTDKDGKFQVDLRGDSLFSRENADTCWVSWTSGGVGYSLFGTDETPVLEIGAASIAPLMVNSAPHPVIAVDGNPIFELEAGLCVYASRERFFSSDSDRAIHIDETEETVKPWLSIWSLDQSEELDARICVAANLYEHDFYELTSEGDYVIQPVSPFERGAADQSIERFVEYFAEGAEKFDQRLSHVRERGGVIQLRDFEVSIASLNVGENTFKFNAADGDGERWRSLTLTEKQLAHGSDAIVYKGVNDNNGEYMIELPPVRFESAKAFTHIKRNKGRYALPLDKDGILEAQLVLKACNEQKSAIGRDLYRATIVRSR